MDQTTLERLTQINTGLLVIVIWKVFFAVDNTNSTVHTMAINSTSTEQQPFKKPLNTNREMSSSGGGASNYSELLDQTIEPLERAFSEHGEEAYLPSDQEIQAAIDSNNLKSPESQQVLSILESGYAKFNMPFPKLEIPTGEQRTSSTYKSPIQNEAPENFEAPNYGEWLRRTAEKLGKVLDEKKERHTGLIPTEQEIQAAIDTADPLSYESRLVIDMLKNGYARFKIDFPSYAPSSSSTKQEASKSVQQKASQKRILKAYFQGQIQRLVTESANQSIDLKDKLPAQEQVEQAIESGTLQSDVSKQVLEQIEACYIKLGLTFYRPPSQ